MPATIAVPLPGCGDHLRQQVAAAGPADQQDADEHRQPAGGREDQRLAGRAPGRQPGAAAADQQEREDGGELPEHVQQEQVVGEDQAEHRAGERDELCPRTGRCRRRRLEVPGAVDQHQRADPGDQQREGRARARRAAARSAGRARDPRRRLPDLAAAGDRRQLGDGQPKAAAGTSARARNACRPHHRTSTGASTAASRWRRSSAVMGLRESGRARGRPRDVAGDDRRR